MYGNVGITGMELEALALRAWKLCQWWFLAMLVSVGVDTTVFNQQPPVAGRGRRLKQ
jgi:hypothetical protein